MRRTALCSIAIALLCAFQIAPAQAQPARVFVAAQGSDSNPCTFALPCRTFQHAHDVVAASGEIDVLDPAGYGALTISKSVSIQGHEFSGPTVPSGGNRITITAGPDDEINLRGLIIEGAGNGSNGIRLNSGKSLTIENCVIRNMAVVGIDFRPTTLLSNLVVSNTFIAGNAGSGAFIFPSGSTPIVRAVFTRVELHNNANGISVLASATNGGSIHVSAIDSVASNNASNGFIVSSVDPQANGHLLLLRSASVNNNIGVTATGSNATLRLAQSAFAGNVTAYSQSNSANLY